MHLAAYGCRIGLAREVPQGSRLSPLSPLLFSLYMSPVYGLHPGVCNYINDVGIVLYSPSAAGL